MIYRNFGKRFFDIIFSLLLFPFLLILIFLIGPFIYFEEKGPIFFIGSRAGKFGKKFYMFKFRTMKLNSPDLRNANGSTFNSKSDFRLLRIGKFLRKYSIDEIPQILNVLIGNMSFVGPRPDLHDQLFYYNSLHIPKFKVKPGITGYAQVNGRNLNDWEKKLVLDNFYAETYSFFLDLKIIILTLFKVLTTRGVYGS
jgi:lipopolysaccharide/colanic/teichoic acid biosynthesis glycosyltransferase